jgi:hypothetical protein
VDELGLDRSEYGTHSIRRTKATLIYRRTKNLRAVQLLLGHAKLESTVRYLGIEVDDALEISEQTDILFGNMRSITTFQIPKYSLDLKWVDCTYKPNFFHPIQQHEQVHWIGSGQNHPHAVNN